MLAMNLYLQKIRKEFLAGQLSIDPQVLNTHCQNVISKILVAKEEIKLSLIQHVNYVYFVLVLLQTTDLSQSQRVSTEFLISSLCENSKLLVEGFSQNKQ